MRVAVAVDLSCTKSDRRCYGLDGNPHHQLIQETLPTGTPFGYIGTDDAMGEFEHGEDRDGDFVIARFRHY